MRSKLIFGFALALGTLVAVPAFAHGDKGLSFPVPAATFKQHVDARMTKAREHMEKRASQLPADQAKELRAKFDANTAKVNAEVAKAIADGTVTKEEADAVRAASPHGRGGHGNCGKDKNEKK
ncbi:MAG TPA: hypothetical protein VM925_27450 [Labilithrix sp.]|nr:hypothetical protein [Labilithrix sp.]